MNWKELKVISLKTKTYGYFSLPMESRAMGRYKNNMCDIICPDSFAYGFGAGRFSSQEVKEPLPCDLTNTFVISFVACYLVFASGMKITSISFILFLTQDHT